MAKAAGGVLAARSYCGSHALTTPVPKRARDTRPRPDSGSAYAMMMIMEFGGEGRFFAASARITGWPQNTMVPGPQQTRVSALPGKLRRLADARKKTLLSVIIATRATRRTDGTTAPPPTSTRMAQLRCPGTNLRLVPAQISAGSRHRPVHGPGMNPRMVPALST